VSAPDQEHLHQGHYTETSPIKWKRYYHQHYRYHPGERANGKAAIERERLEKGVQNLDSMVKDHEPTAHETQQRQTHNVAPNRRKWLW